MSYTPGLQVKASTRYRIQRALPISGKVLVSHGQTVTAEQVVARTEQPGDVIPLNLANALSIGAGDVAAAMLKQVGETVHKGDELARSKGIFGFFRQSYPAPADGTVESVSQVTGQVILRGPPSPVQVNAFVAGEIVEVLPNEGVTVETTAAFIQGIFGVGGERHGTLKVVTVRPEDDLTPDAIRPEHRGAVVVGGRRILGETVAKARELGVNALIAGGIDDQDLKAILGYDLGVAITGSEHIGLTIIITEGFGEIAMAARTFALLRSLDGLTASVNGATQIRAGVLRPEIVVPLPNVANAASQPAAERVAAGILEIGSHVRLIRDPYFGELGKVTALPVEPMVLASGSKARVLEVQCQSGQRVMVPRANVEIVVE
ncbi:hypothetical protein [Planctomicrobium piriforme]|uniref:RnfC Barrel sandwich hybrid domain-containing protein n=1 Tax=Planctomicrobium piriforme TaxID=1576369 RepID=A0A1I3DCX0_9PLAN|nr:hypothetical protein [Planctomicrobium piriforme]SFH84321.1 hypothetical protein SAMN05421753_103177 [Planctomicrobium piriforme]